MTVYKIISGGQTGADQGGLLAAVTLQLQTGGHVPKGWRTEKGPQPFLASYGMREHASREYPARTLVNVQNSDGTVIFSNTNDGGSQLTIRLCVKHRKPWRQVRLDTSIDESIPGFCAWLKANHINVLNVAGNRESKHPGIQIWVANFIIKALEVR